MPKFKDVAHLYLGCDILLTPSNIEGNPVIESLTAEMLCDGIDEFNQDGRYIPLLYPLSSIDDDTAKTILKAKASYNDT